jgi:tRNA pseudouridine13 synthase
LPQSYPIPCWSYVFGGPVGQGVFRAKPDDFVVNEIPAFELSGEGEHAYLKIEKCSENTDYVARQLAKFANLPTKHVSYAGLKDRHARTTQWFSVWLPGKKDPDWSAFNTETITVKATGRHARKLKRGSLSGNHFSIRIRDWQGDKEQAEYILQAIKMQGIANYFGSQRFGIDGQNVNKAAAVFNGEKVKRLHKSIYLSAVRSFLFNQVLAERIKQQNWNSPLVGDALMFDKSGSYFQAQIPDEDIRQRVSEGSLHPTGMMWGKGVHEVSGETLEIEKKLIMQYQDLATGLENAGLEMARRSLRVNVEDMQWHYLDSADLQLQFSLPSGSYATALLRELITI